MILALHHPGMLRDLSRAVIFGCAYELVRPQDGDLSSFSSKKIDVFLVICLTPIIYIFGCGVPAHKASS